MDAQIKTNMEEFRKKVNAYGRRLTEEGVKKAAVDLSYRAENAVKRDFITNFYQTPSHGGSGKRVRTGRLKSSVQAIVRSQTQFGVSSNVVYARIHEMGGRTRPHVIKPVNAKALAFNKGGKTVFAKKVNHPGSLMPARHWMSKPMFKELNKYIDDQIEKLERKPL